MAAYRLRRALAVVGLVYGIIYLTEGSTRGVVSNWAWATLFGVSRCCCGVASARDVSAWFSGC